MLGILDFAFREFQNFAFRNSRFIAKNSKFCFYGILNSILRISILLLQNSKFRSRNSKLYFKNSKFLF